MSRKRLSRRSSKRNFRKHAMRIKSINTQTTPMRGGIRL